MRSFVKNMFSLNALLAFNVAVSLCMAMVFFVSHTTGADNVAGLPYGMVKIAGVWGVLLIYKMCVVPRLYAACARLAKTYPRLSRVAALFLALVFCGLSLMVLLPLASCLFTLKRYFF